ncbi:hypothetical protein QBC43DRAFT_16038 [Cladorrhinum sp. PSN259]|nr:hypothetical protein QBC43DRAFT_16038 [Cladorrhinum sp. PSN259]
MSSTPSLPTFSSQLLLSSDHPESSQLQLSQSESSHQERKNENETEDQLENQQSQEREWDKTTASIYSASTVDLHESRPNRWRGHPSTWKTWTKNERKTWYALENTRNRELAAHLYNVWGLRNGVRPLPSDDKEEGGKEEKWEGWKRLGNKWTSWPVKVDEVPGEGLLPERMGLDDADEEWTFKREEEGFVGRNLEEEISARVLNVAGRRLRRRLLGKQEGQGVGSGLVQSVEGLEEGDEDVSVMEEEGTDDDLEEEPENKKGKRKLKHVQQSFRPVISADDERSYELLRPAARRIMKRLDGMLMVLHEARVAGIANVDDEEEQDEDMEDEEERFWGRVPPPPVQQEVKKSVEGRNLGGRPKKERTKLEGETEEEFQIRIAREGKRRLPSAGPDSGRSRSRRRESSMGRRSRSVSRASRATSRSRRSGSRSSSASSTQSTRSRIDRWKPRDWRDVLGAAALAGFSPEVIARATQRCATLFRGEMTMNTLHEQPVTSAKSRVQTARYVPGVPLPATSDEEEDEDEQQLINFRTVSRQSSVKVISPEQVNEPATAASTPSRRSRSATPGGMHLCSYPSCPRSIDGFTRKANLTRHIKLVHTKNSAPEGQPEDAGDQDSMDEMYGGVHVDGFLQVIKMRKGWRGEDTGQRTRRYQKKSSAAATRSGRDDTAGEEEDLTSDG